MTAETLVAWVGCHECGALAAEVLRSADGRLVVRHRLPMGIAERSERHVEVRPWETSAVGDGDDKSTWQFWACSCKDVRCDGLLVLERRRVNQLAESAATKGCPVRWTPAPADIERSNRLRPYVNTYLSRLPGAEPPEALLRLRMSEPPPLNVRPIRVHRRRRHV